jgi:hypothetical protein
MWIPWRAAFSEAKYAKPPTSETSNTLYAATIENPLAIPSSRFSPWLMKL